MVDHPQALRNIQAQVVERLGTGIVRGDVAPGEPIASEMRICEMLNVSRTVVREAIRVLSGKGLVEARPRSGTRVRPPELWNQLDPDVLRWQLETADLTTYLMKLFRLRSTVEPMAAAYAASSGTEADIARIRAAAEAMAAAGSNEAWVEADIDFHRAIHVATRNEFFWPIAQMFEVVLRRSFTLAAPGDHRPRAILEHRRVMEAIASRDPDAARGAMEELIAHSAGDLKRLYGIDPRSGPTPATRAVTDERRPGIGPSRA
ncbi:FadR/GntR family transcriptional regulator [Roseomonas indoligenes]|uniref:FadR family transcriptional regulator n=1 Tax=Roseomonas indoligenes TaxID=2820811 RepID=A0A940MWA4_9PROT|nr:FadR/GntR family transcriptional regulator [Pararoseomonas indoligenes]MBP0495393.1 FadR family transcriptional regulator [Pararoseomonas indoligenes]